MPPFFLTTPIYYVNDAPHIGTAYCTVNADACARWHRMIGDDVFFLTGTDEHGAKIAEAAAAHDMTPEAWTNSTVIAFEKCWKKLAISQDDFIRTTEARHYETVRSFLQTIYDNGYIELGSYRGLYCISCEDYYTEDELDDLACPIHKRKVTEMEEENYFFSLSKFEDRLLAYYQENPDAVIPHTKRNEVLGFIKGGLRDISITRTSVRWGVPVPWDDRHVFYVWYDALVNYLTAIDYGRDQDRFERYWPVAHHLIGKDILKFHCVWWPAMCMAAGITPATQVVVSGFLLVGGEKLSKTKTATDRAVRVTDISPDALIEDFGSDPIRYHLLREVPLGSDGEFSYESIVSRYNADLANNFGNLLSRVATVITTKSTGIIPTPDPKSPLVQAAAESVAAVRAAWARFAPHEALEATWRLIGAANAQLETTEPWKKDPGPKVDAILGSAGEALRIVTILAAPAMPEMTKDVWKRLGLKGAPVDVQIDEATAWGHAPSGRKIEKGPPLFPRRKS